MTTQTIKSIQETARLTLYLVVLNIGMFAIGLLNAYNTSDMERGSFLIASIVALSCACFTLYLFREQLRLVRRIRLLDDLLDVHGRPLPEPKHSRRA